MANALLGVVVAACDLWSEDMRMCMWEISSIRWLCGVWGAAFCLGACSFSARITDTGQGIEFLSPADDATVQEDADSDTDGIQVALLIRATGDKSDDTTVYLSREGTTEVLTGTTKNGKVTITATLPVGFHTLKASFTDPDAPPLNPTSTHSVTETGTDTASDTATNTATATDTSSATSTGTATGTSEGGSASVTCDQSTCDEITFQVLEPAAQAVSSCVLTTPASGTTITEDAYPPSEPDPSDPVEVDIVVTCGAEHFDKAVSLTIGSTTIVGQDAQGTAAFTKVTLAEGQNDIVVGSNYNSDTGVAAATTTATLFVSTGRCEVSLSPGSRSFNAKDDTDATTTGLQTSLAVQTTCAATSTITLTLVQGGVAAVTPLYSGAAQSTTTEGTTHTLSLGAITLPESVSLNDIQLQAQVKESDAEGATTGASVPQTYSVDTVAPVISSALPANDACYGTDVDSDALTAGIQGVNASGVVSATDEGSEVWLRASLNLATDQACTSDDDCQAVQKCRPLADSSSATTRLCRQIGEVNSTTGYVVSNISLPAPSDPTAKTQVEVIVTDLAGNESAASVSEVVVFDQEPTVSIVKPTANQGLGTGDDTDNAQDGVQFQMEIATANLPAFTSCSNDADCGDGGTCTGNVCETSFVSISGQNDQSFVSAEGTSTPTVTFGNGQLTVSATVHNACGVAVTSEEASVYVDTVVPVISLALPADDACYGTDIDSDALTAGIQGVNASGVVSGTDEDSEVWLRASLNLATDSECVSDDDCDNDKKCRPLADSSSTTTRLCRYVGETTSTTGYVVTNISLPAPTDPAAKTQVEVIVTDLAGNESVPSVSEVVVFDQEPTVSIAKPTANQGLGTGDDTDGTKDGVQFQMEIATANLPAPTSCTDDADCGAGGTCTGTVCETAFVSVTGQLHQSFTPIEGTSTPTVTFDNGQLAVSATVQNACGVDVKSAEISLVAFYNPQPLVLKTLEAGTTTQYNDGQKIADASIDLDVDTGGGEVNNRTITVQFYGASTGSGDDRTCTGSETSTAATASATPVQSGAVLSSLTLKSGINCLLVTSSDTINTETATFVLELRTATSEPTITSPVADTTWSTTDDTLPTTIGFFQNVSVSLSVSTDTVGTLELLSDDVVLTSASIAIGATTHTFTNVSFGVGAHSLTTRYTDDFGLVATSPAISINIQSDGPPVEITSPATDSFLSNAAFVVVVESTGSPEPETCTLYLDGQEQVTTANWSEANQGRLTLDQTLVEKAYAVQVECETDSGGKASTNTVNVTIDDSAPPTLSFVDESGLAAGVTPLVFDSTSRYINSTVADTLGGSTGLQHNVAFTFDPAGAETNGWKLHLSMALTPTSGTTQTYPATPSPIILGSGATGATVSNFFFGNDAGAGGSCDCNGLTGNGCDVLDGTVVLSAYLEDQAGNTSPTSQATFTMDRTCPSFSQVSPDPSESVFTLADDIGNDPDYVTLNFRYSVSGAIEGVTDCSGALEDCASLKVTPTATMNTDPSADYPLDPDAEKDTIYRPASTGTIAFVRENSQGELGFKNGTYAAVAQVSDVAGNIVSLTHDFDVDFLRPGLIMPDPNESLSVLKAEDDVSSDPHFQVLVSVSALGFPNQTPVVLCSSVAPPVGGGEACRWTSEGVLDSSNAGFKIAEGILTGNEELASAVFLKPTFAQGQQVLHLEAQAASGTPDIGDNYRTITIDSEPPVVTGLSFTQNTTGNDASPTIVFSRSEGTPGGAVGSEALTTTVTAVATGSDTGQSISVFSSLAPTTAIGTGTLDATGSATFDITLASNVATQTLHVTVSDVNGNDNDPTDLQQAVLVDAVLGTVSVSAPVHDPYTSAHGAINVEADPTDNTLDVSVTLSYGDDRSMAGSTVTLCAYDETGVTEVSGSCMTPISVSTTNTSTSTQVTYPLKAGSHHLKATITDAVGNVTSSTIVNYKVDLYGPALALFLKRSNGASISCTSAGSPCDVDIKAPDGNDRVQLDKDNSDSYCDAAEKCGSFTTGGTDLLYTLTGCINAVGVEACDSDVVLQARPISGGAFATVFSSTFTATADVASEASLFTPAASFAFDKGGGREIRLQATDANGNISHSDSRYIDLNEGAVVVSVEILNSDGSGTGTLLADGSALGVSADHDVTAAFKTNFKVHLTDEAGDLTPTQVDITINNGTTDTDTFQTTDIVGSSSPYTAEFVDVSGAVTLNPTNTVTVAVTCGVASCGNKQVTGVVADGEAPTYQFDRCSLCDLGVAIDNSGTHCVDAASCAAANSADNADLSVAVTTFKVADDQDSNPSNGLTILSSPSLVVLFEGMEDGQTVTINTDQGSLTGNTATTSGCEDGDAGTPCQATFSGLQIPTLAGTDRHTLTVAASDEAGNAIVKNALRPSAEEINALVDVDPPATQALTACIGEDTAPTNPGAVADINTTEVASCTSTHCSDGGGGNDDAKCHRRKGNVTLAWSAPDEDAANPGQSVASYTILAAALDIPYGTCSNDSTIICSGNDECTGSCAGTVTYANCSDLDELSDRVEQSKTLSSPQAPGSQETTTFTGLGLHREYCFVAFSTDDAGNSTRVETNRVLPLLNNIPGVTGQAPYIIPFQGVGNNEFTGPPDLQNDARFYNASPGYLRENGVNLGDMDGDDRDDFAILHSTDPAFVPSVRVFMSSDLTTPAKIITQPVSGIGLLLPAASGDFDGDGRSDLILSAAGLTTPAGPAENVLADQGGAVGGAIFIYYGSSPNGLSQSDNCGAACDNLPSLTPDVAIYAPAGTLFGAYVSLGDIDGVEIASQTSDDLLISTYTSAAAPRVFGFFGGSRTRFTDEDGAAPGIQVNLVLSTAPDGSGNKPDFALQGRANRSDFPKHITLADIDGDGKMDPVVSDWTVDHDPSTAAGDNGGEIYVYTGSSSLTGLIAAPTDSGTSPLMHILRAPFDKFGGFVYRIPAPRIGNTPADNADWLLVNSSGRAISVVKASDTHTGGFATMAFPVDGAGIGSDTIQSLLANNWDGTTLGQSYLGYSFSYLGEFDGHGKGDFVVGGTITFGSSQSAISYSYDEVVDSFVRRVIILGPGDFGLTLIGARNLFGNSVGNYDALISAEALNANLYLHR
jgi:hypothetical protein